MKFVFVTRVALCKFLYSFITRVVFLLHRTMDEGSKPPEQTPSLPPVAHKLVPTAEKSNFPPPPVTMSHRENFPTHVPSSSKSDPKGDNVLQISPTVHTTPKPNALPEMAITPTVAHQASDDSTQSGGQESSTPESSSG